MKKMNSKILRILFVLQFSCLLSAHTLALEIGPEDDLRAAIAGLAPGDELVLRGGEYTMNSSFRVTGVGTINAPILVRAKPGHVPVINQTNSNHNIIEVYGSRYFEIRGLTFTGGSHGIRLMDSDYVTIADCEVYETGDVAISANSGGTYTGLQILRNHIHHTNGTGEGMYLGCNNDGCRIKNSLIAENYVHHTNRASVEQGDGIELKEGSSGNVIRDNVIHDTNYPGILVYSTTGNGPPNVIEGNVIWNTNDASIQAAADAVIRNNVILGNGVAFRQHQSGAPGNIQFLHNTVVTRSNGIEVRNVVGPVTIANNALYSENGNAIRLISGDLQQVVVSGNAGEGGLSGGSAGYVASQGFAADVVDGNHNHQPPIDLYPRSSGSLVDAGTSMYSTSVDFNGNARSGIPDAGAYEYSTESNPGWQIAAGFKGTGAIIATTSPKPPIVHDN